MFSKIKVLVTGGSEFIGSPCKILVRQKQKYQL